MSYVSLRHSRGSSKEVKARIHPRKKADKGEKMGPSCSSNDSLLKNSHCSSSGVYISFLTWTGELAQCFVTKHTMVCLGIMYYFRSIELIGLGRRKWKMSPVAFFSVCTISLEVLFIPLSSHLK